MADQVFPPPTLPPSFGVEATKHLFTVKGNWNVGGSKTSLKRNLGCHVEVFTGVSTSTLCQGAEAQLCLKRFLKNC